MRISTIRDKAIQFASMIISYKVTQSNWLNSVSSSCILYAYKIIKENEKIDLCQWMCDELIINLGKIKGEKKGTFWYDNLVCLMLFFLNGLPETGKNWWAFDIPVAKQIKDSIRNMGEEKDRDSILWGYFKSF